MPCPATILNSGRGVNHVASRLSRRAKGYAGQGIPLDYPDSRARIDGLAIAHDLDIDHCHPAALTPSRRHGIFAASRPPRVAGQDISGLPGASGQSSAEIMCFAHNG
jgi:hypothetical protein